MTGFTSSSTNFGTGPAAFDPHYYLAKNADVAQQLSHHTGTERLVRALQHFMEHGAAEGRNPSARFDVAAYCNANPDVAKAGINPLLHFRTSGMKEGRVAFPVREPGMLGAGAPDAPALKPIALDHASLALDHPGAGMDFLLAPAPAAQASSSDPTPGMPPASAAGLWSHGSALQQLLGGQVFLPDAAPIQADAAPGGHAWLLHSGTGPQAPGFAWASPGHDAGLQLLPYAGQGGG